MRSSKKSVDTSDRVDQVAKLEEAGYISASEVVRRTGYTRTTITRWANDESVDSIIVAGNRYLKLASLIRHLGDAQAKIFGFVEPKKKKEGKA